MKILIIDDFDTADMTEEKKAALQKWFTEIEARILNGDPNSPTPKGILTYEDVVPVPTTSDEDTMPRNRRERRQGRKPDKPIWQKKRRQ